MTRIAVAAALVAIVSFGQPAPRVSAAGAAPTIDQFLMPGYPTELASAKKQLFAP